jgi:hypothetical protein
MNIRFLDRIFNEDGDLYVSIYEANEVLEEGLKDNSEEAIKPVLQNVLNQYQSFQESISFSLFSVVPCTDDDKDRFRADQTFPFKIVKMDPTMRSLDSGASPSCVQVRPFHRALIVAEVPSFKSDFKYDHLSLLYYSKKTSVSSWTDPKYSKSTDYFETVPESNIYINRLRDISKVYV